MKELNLNRDQMRTLLEDGELEFKDSNDILQISENDIRISSNGTIYWLIGTEMVFQQHPVDRHNYVDDVKEIMFEYFNLEPKEIILKSVENCEYVFIIRIAPKCEVPIYVCHKKCAVANTREMREKDFDTEADQIGIYKRMGDSEYYFRWLGEEV